MFFPIVPTLNKIFLLFLLLLHTFSSSNSIIIQQLTHANSKNNTKVSR